MKCKPTRTLVLAAMLAVGATSYALAQGSPSPANQSGGGISATTPSPTDPGTAGQTGNTKGTPAMGMRKKKMRASKSKRMMRSPTAGDSRMESMEKTRSPANQNSGIKRQK